MSQLNPGELFRSVTQGILVHRAAATVAADQDLFSIDVGNILLLGLWGRVTVAIGSGSQDLAMHLDPDDGGGNVVIGDASTPLLVDNAVVGNYITLNPTFAADLVLTLDYAANGMLATPLIFEKGDIVLDITGSQAGEIEWWVVYVPIEDGAVLTAV